MKRLPRLDLLAGAPQPWRGWLALGASLALLTASVLTLWPGHADVHAATASAAQPVPLPSSTWTPYFALQTEHGRGEVRLLVVEPGPTRDVVALQGEAPDLPRLMHWLRQLREDPRLSDVELANHEQRDELLGSPVRFSVQARWRQVRPEAPVTDGAQAAQPAPALSRAS